MLEPSERARLVTAIAEQVRLLAQASEHVGHAFATQQGLHPTDFRALSLIYSCERAGEPQRIRRCPGPRGIAARHRGRAVLRARQPCRTRAAAIWVQASVMRDWISAW